MVDMYGLGSVFFDMWWNYKQPISKRNQIIQDISNQKYEKVALKELEEKMAEKRHNQKQSKPASMQMKEMIGMTKLKVFDHYKLSDKVPENAQILIYHLVQKDPRDRPSALDILSS